jgi:hypothetical protein
MITKRRWAINATAILLVFAVAQTFLQVGRAVAPEAVTPKAAAVAPLQGQIGKLTTTNNQPINVNGTSITSGGTVLTDSIIETPDNAGATISLGSLGSLDIAPGTKLKLEYDDQGNVRVTLIEGCVAVHKKKDTKAQIDTEQGTAAKNDKKEEGLLDVCFKNGVVTLNQGTAGLGAVTGGGGLTGTQVFLIVLSTLGGGTALAFALMGDNPSDS